MSVEQELRQEIAALRTEVAELRAQLGTTGIRLGPRPETQEQVGERVERLVEAVAQAVEPVDRSKLCTTNGKPVDEVRRGQTNDTGQHEGYIVLCEEERAKGFVRPYRNAYRHVGPRICGMHVGPDGATVCYMDPKHEGACGVATGRRPSACGVVTTMGRSLSETYARDPSFYGATFCCNCNAHYPVAQFVWTADGQQVGS
jgi:hypothetical protein